MSQFRRRMRIVLDGREIDLVSSARDFAAAEPGDDEELSAMDSFIRVAHAAALRLHVSGIPSDVDTFADLLDDFVDLDKDKSDAEPVVLGKADEVEPDPIRATA